MAITLRVGIESRGTQKIIIADVSTYHVETEKKNSSLPSSEVTPKLLMNTYNVGLESLKPSPTKFFSKNN